VEVILIDLMRAEQIAEVADTAFDILLTYSIGNDVQAMFSILSHLTYPPSYSYPPPARDTCS